MQSIVDTLRGHRSDSQGAAGNVLLPIDSSGIPPPSTFCWSETIDSARGYSQLPAPFLLASALQLVVLWVNCVGHVSALWSRKVF